MQERRSIRSMGAKQRRHIITEEDYTKIFPGREINEDYFDNFEGDEDGDIVSAEGLNGEDIAGPQFMILQLLIHSCYTVGKANPKKKMKLLERILEVSPLVLKAKVQEVLITNIKAEHGEELDDIRLTREELLALSDDASIRKIHKEKFGYHSMAVFPDIREEYTIKWIPEPEVTEDEFVAQFSELMEQLQTTIPDHSEDTGKLFFFRDDKEGEIVNAEFYDTYYDYDEIYKLIYDFTGKSERKLNIVSWLKQSVNLTRIMNTAMQEAKKIDDILLTPIDWTWLAEDQLLIRVNANPVNKDAHDIDYKVLAGCVKACVLDNIPIQFLQQFFVCVSVRCDVKVNGLGNKNADTQGSDERYAQRNKNIRNQFIRLCRAVAVPVRSENSQKYIESNRLIEFNYRKEETGRTIQEHRRFKAYMAFPLKNGHITKIASSVYSDNEYIQRLLETEL